MSHKSTWQDKRGGKDEEKMGLAPILQMRNQGQGVGFSFCNSFVEMKLLRHTIHPSNMYNPVVVSVVTECV